MYKTQKRFEEVSSLLTRMPSLSEDTSAFSISSTGNDSSYSSDAVETPNREPAIPATPRKDDDDDESDVPEVADDGNFTQSKPRAAREMPPASESDGCSAAAAKSDENHDSGTYSASDSLKRTSDSEVNTEEEGRAKVGVATTDGDSAAIDAADRAGKPTGGGGAGRSDSSPSRGAGAARVAGLNKAAAATSAAATIPGVETSVEANVRRLVERHAEAMRANMNELAGELAVTTATRPMATQDWLDSRVAAAEEVSTCR